MEKKNYILDTLELIDNLQKDINNKSNNELSYNTRPVLFYSCSNKPLTISFTNGQTNIFRIEKIDGSCITVRLLVENDNNELVSTGEYATVNINCISAIKCLKDIKLTL